MALTVVNALVAVCTGEPTGPVISADLRSVMGVEVQ
jgi:hypothetical protein